MENHSRVNDKPDMDRISQAMADVHDLTRQEFRILTGMVGQRLYKRERTVAGRTFGRLLILAARHFRHHERDDECVIESDAMSVDNKLEIQLADESVRV